jgi:hypothetical protein
VLRRRLWRRIAKRHAAQTKATMRTSSQRIYAAKGGRMTLPEVKGDRARLLAQPGVGDAPKHELVVDEPGGRDGAREDGGEAATIGADGVARAHSL